MSRPDGKRSFLGLTFTKQQRVGLVIIVVLLALVSATLVIPESSSPSDASSTSTTIAGSTTTAAPTTTTEPFDPAKLGGDARAAYELVQLGRSGQYRVRFQQSGEGMPPAVTAAFVEIWRSGALIRQDSTHTEVGGVTRSLSFGGPDGIVSCLEQPGIAMNCQQTDPRPHSGDDDFLTTIVSLLPRSTITTSDRTIAGIPGRCFLVNGGSATSERGGEICLSAAGVPLLVDVQRVTVEALEVSNTVAPSDFTPPVPVSGITTQSTTIDTVITPSSAGG